MKIAVYVGNFDPVTLGHVDIIQRASRVADRLVIGVYNQQPDKFMFRLEQRMICLKLALPDMPHVIVKQCSQDIVNFAKANGARVIIRGVRNSVEFEYELSRAQVNRKMEPEMDTLFLMTGGEYSFLRSAVVRELLDYGKDISCFVPPEVADIIYRIRVENWRIINGKKSSVSRSMPHSNRFYGGSAEHNPSSGTGSDCYKGGPEAGRSKAGAG